MDYIFEMNKKTAIFSIFLIVFFDLCGFGMIIPLTPYLSQKFGADSVIIGLLLSSYSFMQFLFNPFWGQLSDKYGRRPIILLSLLGASFSDLIFAFSPSLFWLFVSRFLSGFFGANVATAFAYVADITDKEKRSVSMGLIGAALGLGFLFGPFFGALGGQLGHLLGAQAPFGDHFPGLLSSVLRGLNFILAFFILKESVREKKSQTKKISRFHLFLDFLKKPVVSTLLIGILFYSISMTILETGFFLFLYDQFQWNYIQSSYAFCYVGFMIIFTQGFLIRKIIPILGEYRTLLWGLIFLICGFFGIALSTHLALLTLFITFICLGSGFFQPSLHGLLSLKAASEDQGKIFGVSHSLSSLGRVIGPALGGFLYYFFKPISFLFSCLLMAVVLLFFIRVNKKNDRLKKTFLLIL